MLKQIAYLSAIVCVDRVVKATRNLLAQNGSISFSCDSCGARGEARKLSDLFIIEPIK